jgi:hypothetical protein
MGNFDLQRMDEHRDHEPRRSADFSPQERSMLRTADDSQALGACGRSCGINPALRFPIPPKTARNHVAVDCADS